MNRDHLMFLLFGFIIGTLAIGTFLYFRNGKSFNFLTGEHPKDTFVRSLSFQYDEDGLEPVPQGHARHSKIGNFRNFHSIDSPTYYIDTAGFRQLIDSSNSLLMIELGCNGNEGAGAKHGYSLLISRYDTLKKMQFFAKMDTVDKQSGRRVIVDAYLDKTCPCPISGNKCPCENLSNQ